MEKSTENNYNFIIYPNNYNINNNNNIINSPLNDLFYDSSLTSNEDNDLPLSIFEDIISDEDYLHLSQSPLIPPEDLNNNVQLSNEERTNFNENITFDDLVDKEMNIKKIESIINSQTDPRGKVMISKMIFF